MPELANLVNSDLTRDFTVSQVAEKHNWTEPMALSLALEGREDIERFKELGWGLRSLPYSFLNNGTVNIPLKL